MASNAINKAQQAVQQVLEALNITQVVFVDDVFIFRNLVAIEQALGYFAVILYKDSDTAINIIDVPLPLSPDDDAWNFEFRDKWDRLSPLEQQEKAKQLAMLSETHPRTDFEVEDKLKGLFPATIQKHFLSPSAWENTKSTIIQQLSPQSRLLCFFDQDLRSDRGFSDQGSHSGGGLLSSLLGGQNNDYIFAGILSHKIPEIIDERDYRLTFARQYGIEGLNSQQFIPLAKSRLQDLSLLQIADGIKKVVLNAFSENLKSAAKDILNQAHIRAIQQLDDLDVYTFDRMILRHYQEGEWEADTLARIFQIFQRDAMRELLLDETASSKFNQTVLKARPISAITTLDEMDVYPRVRNIRRLELYEGRKIIKHTPLQVGDIFTKVIEDGSLCTYILLTQPCDLAVRSDGTRAGKFIPLIPIHQEEDSYKSKKSRRKWQDYWSTRALLENYHEKTGTLAVLEFKKAEWISTDVLDLSVFDGDGRCQIDLNVTCYIPYQLTVGWQQLLKNLVERFKTHRERLDTHKHHATTSPDLWKSLMPKLCLTDFLPTESYATGVFDFKLQRIERFRQPGADMLLKLFTQFLSRDARNFDFSE